MVVVKNGRGLLVLVTMKVRHDSFLLIGGILLLSSQIWSVSAVLYFFISIDLILIFQGLCYFYSLVISFQFCCLILVALYPLKNNWIFLVSIYWWKVLNFMFTMILKSYRKFLRFNVPLVYTYFEPSPHPHPALFPRGKWGGGWYGVFKILNNGGSKYFNINGWVRHNSGV